MSGLHPLRPDEAREVTLRIDSRFDHVELVARAVRGLCAAAGMPGRDAAGVEIAVAEAVNNVIRHAYGCETGHPIDVAFVLERGRVTIEVSDEGTPMAPRTSPVLDFDPADVASLPEGGMGLFLIHQVMDQVEVRRHGERNTLAMSRRLAA